MLSLAADNALLVSVTTEWRNVTKLILVTLAAWVGRDGVTVV